MGVCEALNTDESRRRLPKHAQTFLQERDYGFARLDGQMVRKSRDDAMSRFETDPNCTVFLISLKCGSLGLNLTAASQVILVSSVVCAPSLRASIGISFIGVAGLGVAVRRLQDGSVVEPGTCGAAGVWAPDILPPLLTSMLRCFFTGRTMHIGGRGPGDRPRAPDRSAAPGQRRALRDRGAVAVPSAWATVACADECD